MTSDLEIEEGEIEIFRIFKDLKKKKKIYPK